MFKKKMSIFILSFVMVIGCFITSSSSVSAVGNGWTQENGTWYYYQNGAKVKNAWKLDSNGWCFLSSFDGSWVQEGWALDSHGWGYIQNGYWVQHSMWAKDSNGWLHIGDDGYWDGKAPVASIPASNGSIKISYIDVGQADSILIQQGSSSMLIDAGNNDDATLVKNYISNQGITSLDYVIGTHPHEDHIGGMDYIINSFKIGKIYMPKVTTTTQTFQDVITALKNKGMSITTPVPGSSFKLGDATCTILGPINSNPDDLNSYSIVLKVTYGSKSFLFTGDAQSSNEQDMINAGYNLSADVLKVGHHGSYTSTALAFLNKVNPKYAVISVGKGNDYGHPSSDVLTRLQSKSINVYRTDLSGTIVCTSDGNSINFSCNPNAGGAGNTTSSDTGTNTGGNTSGSTSTHGNIQIIGLDLRGELVTIKNMSSQNQDMTGWKLVSVVGNQVYNFTYGYTLNAGSTVTIASGTASGTIKWTTANIWNNDGDKAELYDSYGALVSSK